MNRITYDRTQKSVVEENMLSFQNAVSNAKLEEAIDKIKVSNENELKTFAISVVSQAKGSTIGEKNSLAEMIEAWSIHLNSFEWAEELKGYCRQKADIRAAYSVRFLNKMQIVIVMDDMSNDSVLEHNEFAFCLRSRYSSNIHDFMVIDIEAFSYMKDEFEMCKEIYKRG